MRRTKFSQEKYALEIFSSEAYLTINKKLLQHYGPEVAVFLSNLVDKYKYFTDHNLIQDGWFFLIHNQQIRQTGLTVTKIRSCKTILKSDGIIEIKRKGIPAKEWYKLNLHILLDLLQLTSCHKDSLDQDIRNPEDINKDPKSKENKDKDKKNNKNQIPPTLEMIKEYCQERNNKVDPDQWFDFYSSKGWMIGKNHMKDWQAAVRTWERGNSTMKQSTSPDTGSRRWGTKVNYNRLDREL